MTDYSRPDEIVTPEAVALTLDVAGLGSRMIAITIDNIIQGVMILIFVLVFVHNDSVAGFSGGAGIAIVFVAVFLIVWGYFPLFEGLNGGRTPGKRAQRLRVVRVDGQPAGFGPVVVRNLLRIVDYLPTGYAIGAITILMSKRSQRVGDMAAGTIVIRDRPAPAPSPVGSAPPAVRMDTTGLRERDYDVARSFLQRRATLDPAARNQLASKIAAALRTRVPSDAPQTDEEFIESTVRSYRDRFSGDH